MKPSAVLWTVGLGSLLAAMIYPVFAPGSSHVNSVHTRCLSGVKQLATGHLIYASDFDDTSPNELFGLIGRIPT